MGGGWIALARVLSRGWRTPLQLAMMCVVGVRARLASLDFWLHLVLFGVSVWLVVANQLSRSEVPSKAAWEPGKPLFLTVVAAGIYVAGFALYKYFDARRTAESERQTDVIRFCQQVAWRVTKACEQVDPTKLTVGFWLCQKSGSFDCRMRLLLPANRPSSEVVWRRGVGVAGSLWDTVGEPDRLEKLTVRNAMDSAAFGRLPKKEQLGLSHILWKSVSAYTGVVAVKLVHDTGATKKLLGFLVIDYRGDLVTGADGLDALDCIGEAVRDDDVAELRGGLVTRLARRA